MQGGLSKLKKKHIGVKRQKVKLFRANEPLLSVLMWGVNHTVRIYINIYYVNRLLFSLKLFYYVILNLINHRHDFH